MATLKELYEKIGTLNAEARAIINKADKDESRKSVNDGKQRELTAEESARIDAIYTEVDGVQEQIAGIESAQKQRDRVAKTDEYLQETSGRKTVPASVTPSGAEPAAQGVLRFSGGEVRVKPGSQEAIRSSPEYQAAMASYLSDGFRAGMLTSSDPKGGYLTTMDMSSQVIKFLDNQVFMRQISNVLPPLTQAVGLGVPSWDTDPGDAAWGVEVPASALSEDDTATVGKRELVPHVMTLYVKVSRKLLRSSVIPMETFLSQRLAYKAGVTEEQAFLTGAGAPNKPLGVFVASNDGIPTSRDTTAASTTAFTADELIDTQYACKEGYIRSGVWILHRDTVKRCRKLKDGNGQYIWQPGLSGQPGTLLDRPYYMSEYAPNTYTTGLYVAIFGDFKTGYMIVDSLAMEIQRLDELLALTNQVGFVLRKETDGMPVLSEAFSRLKLA